MPRLALTSLALLGIILSQPLHAELLVIVNTDSSIDQLTRHEVMDIYMGRQTSFPNGRTALPIDLAADSPTRAAYYQTLVGETVPQVNAYWARLLFTGRATPPKVLPDAHSVIEVIQENRDAIAYIDSRDLSPNVKVILELK